VAAIKINKRYKGASSHKGNNNNQKTSRNCLLIYVLRPAFVNIDSKQNDSVEVGFSGLSNKRVPEKFYLKSLDIKVHINW